MSFRERFPDEILDMDVEELRESDEFDWDEEMNTVEEFREHIGDMHDAFEVYSGSILLARMFDDGFITLGEYLDLMDHVHEYESDLSVNLR